MSYRVLLHKRAAKYLQELDEETRNRIKEYLRELENFPKPKLDLIKLAGEENTFRARIGKYRALLKVYEREQVIVIIKIDVRGRMYGTR